MVGRKTCRPTRSPSPRPGSRRTAPVRPYGRRQHGAPCHHAFRADVGAPIDQIPYRGGAPALQDVDGGHVDLFLGPARRMIAPISAGAVKGFGITASKRMKQLPDVPALGAELDPKLEIRFWHASSRPPARRSRSSTSSTPPCRSFFDDPKIVQQWDEIAVYAYPEGAALAGGRPGAARERDQALGRSDPREQDRGAAAVSARRRFNHTHREMD